MQTPCRGQIQSQVLGAEGHPDQSFGDLSIVRASFRRDHAQEVPARFSQTVRSMIPSVGRSS
jgi:hypothetical protein